MTLQDMLDRISARIGDQSQTRVQPLVMVSMVQDAQSRVARETWGYRKTYDISTVAEQAEYDLPDGFLREYRVTVVNSDGSEGILVPRPALESYGTVPSTMQSMSFYWIKNTNAADTGLKIVLWGAPAVSDETIQIDMAMDTGAITEGSSGLDLPSQFHDAVFWEALSQVAELPEAGVPEARIQGWGMRAHAALGEARRISGRFAGKQGTMIPTPF